MTLIGLDAWLEAPYYAEGDRVTCAGQDTHGVYLKDWEEVSAPHIRRIGLDKWAEVLAHEDLAEGVRKLLVEMGMAYDTYVTECPKKGSVLTEDDYAPGTDCCGTCGGPTRIMDREELRGE